MENVERLATFHDAELRQVSHKAEFELLELGFEKADGQFVVVSLCGVAAFRATDMGVQNVVSRLLVHGSNMTLTEDELVERVGWVSRTCDGEQLAQPAALNALVHKIVSGERLLFILEPSWGAEVIAIAEKLVL
jgi:hypothetical protein